MDLNNTKDDANATRNLAGGHAHEVTDPLERLRMVTINNLLEDTYYQEDTESLEELHTRFTEAAAEDAEFPLQLAAWARQEAYVRDVPQVLLVFAAWDEANGTREYVREYAPQIIDRADELTTVLAFNNAKQTGSAGDFSGEVPWVLKRALADVIESGKFDAYQYAKYRNDSRAVSMRDVFNVAHPFGYDDSPDPESVVVRDGDGETTMGEIANRLTKGDKDDHPDVEPLRQQRTWEDVISDAGQEPDGVTADDWRGVLDDMGLFARIRNLRNMLQAGLDGEEILGDVGMDWVRNSQVYPFRFYQAHKALLMAHDTPTDDYVHEWLEDAVEVACENVPDGLDNTATLVDLSGSMGGGLSANSNMTPREIAALFGAMLGTRGARVVGFGEEVEELPDDPLASDSVLATQDRIVNMDVGHSTFAHKAVEHVAEVGEVPDRVVVFTDFQIWSTGGYGNDPNALRGAWEQLRDAHDGEPHLYIVDLASYGQIKLPESYPNVHRIQGWSDQTLDYIWHAENSLLDDIRDV